MKISYGVTVADEIKEIQTLLPILINNKSINDEIVVQYDNQKVTVEVLEYLNDLVFDKKIARLVGYPLNKDFATFKQHLTQNCEGDWIFQLDADETLDEALITGLGDILNGNPDIDMFFIPRINIVEGLTEAHIQKWRWNVNENGWVNFPDVQTRIYKNSDKIGWSGKVHERIVGFESYTSFPADEIYCIRHPKTIERQEKQNNYYDTL